MEKENKISKGIVAGCLVMVMALTIWVININDTYSTDSSTTPKCKTINGIEYKYVSNATNDQYGCCPVSDTAKIGSLGSGNKCFSYTVNGSCPAGYTVYNEGNCIANLGKVDNSACYFCSGTSVTGSNYMWSESMPTATCDGGSWTKSSTIANESDCKETIKNYEVTFELNGGKLYENGQFKQRNVISLSKLDYSIYTAEYTAEKDQIVFRGWDINNSCNSPKKSGTINIKQKTTIYACYSKKIDVEYYYKVYLNASKKDNVNGIVYNNGVNTNKNEFVISDVKENTIFSLSKYTAKINGYTFKGWSKSSVCQEFVTILKIEGDKRFYACYEKTSGSVEEPKVYKVTFDPNGGTWLDGANGIKVKEYTSKKYFTDDDIAIKKDGYKFLGWKNEKGDVFNIYVDASDNNSTLKALWQINSSGGTTPTPNPDIGDESKCEYIYKDSCELAYEGYNCIKDNNNCYIKGTKKDDDNPSTGEICDFESKNACEIVNEGYNCELDSNGCYIKGTKKDTGGGNTGSDNNDIIDNPQTGSSLIYIAIIIGIITLGYTIYYTYNLKRNEVK